MKNICFIPDKFNDIKLGYNENSITPCSPDFPNELTEINTIKINIPEKVIYKNKGESTFIIPLCMVYSVSLKRIYKYNHLSAQLIHVKKTENDSVVYTGQIYDKEIRNRDAVPDPSQDYIDKEKQRKIQEAKMYSDDELGSGVVGASFRNINLVDYVDMPFSSGKYEVYLSYCGIESNHAIVDITVDGDVKVLYNGDLQTETPKEIRSTEEEELPEI